MVRSNETYVLNSDLVPVDYKVGVANGADEFKFSPLISSDRVWWLSLVTIVCSFVLRSVLLGFCGVFGGLNGVWGRTKVVSGR